MFDQIPSPESIESTSSHQNIGLYLATATGELINSQAKPSFRCLPDFQQPNVRSNTAEDDAPLPCDSLVLEDQNVELRNVDKREYKQEAGDHGPEQEFVMVDGLEHGERTTPAFIHGEETL